MLRRDLRPCPQLKAQIAPCIKRHGGENLLISAVFLALWGILCRHLSSEWTVNEQYAYGWFVPFLALFLFWSRWEHRPLSEPPPQSQLQRAWIMLGSLVLALLLPIRLVEVANPDWRPLGWIHAAIAISLTLLALWTVGGTRWLGHFSFPVGFFLVAVPWVSPIENPIVQGLQVMVAAVDVEIMAMFGIPAQLEGSVIRLRTGVVGVNEACSGIRSLQTSIMVGLLLGEISQFRWGRRWSLVLITLGLAFGANVLRGAFLVWIAAAYGILAVERVHDGAGYGVLLFVFAGSMGLTALLRKHAVFSFSPTSGSRYQSAATKTVDAFEDEAREDTIFSRSSTSSTLSPRWLVLILCWLVSIEAGVEGWYRLHEQGLVAKPRWSVRWPKAAPGFHQVRLDEGTRRTLRFDEGGAVAWLEETGGIIGGEGTHENFSSTQAWLLYFFRWLPGNGSILRARAHRPDICFPNTGWRQTADCGLHLYEAPGQIMPFRHFAFFHDGNSTTGGPRRYAHAFFCVQGDKVAQSQSENETAVEQEVSGTTGTWAIADRLRAAWKGRRDPGQQVMEVVLTTGSEISASEAEKAFRRVLKGLVTTIKGKNEQ